MRGEPHRLNGRIAERVAELRDRLSRARYFRGHGVHSPFVYKIVRGVFMADTLLPGDRKLYAALLGEGVAPRRAVQLQNLAIHCDYPTFGLNRADENLCVATRACSVSEIAALAEEASRRGTTLVVLEPCASRERLKLCRELIAAHRSTTVDNRAYLLIFNNHLPKQHFRI